MKKIVFIILVLVLAGTGFFMYLQDKPTKVANPQPMPEYGEIKVEQAAPLFAEGLPEKYAIVDARSKSEYEKEHTEGTINVPEAIFANSINPCAEIMSKLPKNKDIIFVSDFGSVSDAMYRHLTNPEDKMGCGMQKYGLYNLMAKVKFKKDRLIVQRQ